jgi:hypothetical protein
MDAPTCRLCGDRHWGSCPKFEDNAKARAVKRVLSKAVLAVRQIEAAGRVPAGLEQVAENDPTRRLVEKDPKPLPVARCPTCGQKLPGSKPQQVYVREYMRKRRAAKKAEMTA